MTFSLNEGCFNNDHYWHGGSACKRCNARLRCGCGQFVRDDSFDEHLNTKCRYRFIKVEEQ